ncbi:aminoglycoside phosphotransferase [Microlunatus endophyticus]|uniref:Aminoglycoside phosphotransferase n=1 Tax=Microlunatus endophyticus TaxID=1716077 RepID=A0A917SGZ0_9ACTN|nr:aminoglycoside phosphotransferase family protein [Microlunatus endophyticus]GGL78532.1 aminoglycoside phosphotransferase [Microlunatus endophyticus]
MRMPAAEVEVTAELVTALIRQQHLDLLDELSLVANGWDNVIYRLGRTRTVRLPRRQLVAELIIKEQRWLPELAPRLPLSIPVPERAGRPGPGFDWPWSIGPWFDGDPLSGIPVSERTRYAADLAAFFAALHRPAPPDAPVNPVRGIPLAQRAELVAQQFAIVDPPGRLRTLWDELVTTRELTGPPVWVHGDPHPANLLIKDGRLAAVIDFGDLTAGDPATDLAVGWLAFDPVGRSRFRDHYVRIAGDDADLWRRARGWALSLGLSLLANSDDNPVLAAVGRHAVDQVIQE